MSFFGDPHSSELLTTSIIGGILSDAFPFSPGLANRSHWNPDTSAEDLQAVPAAGCSHVPLIQSFVLPATHCIGGRGSLQEPHLPNPGTPQAWLPFADPLLHTTRELNGFKSILQFLFPHPIPGFLTFAWNLERAPVSCYFNCNR